MTWLAVILIGAFVGISELLVRYRDNPLATIITTSSLWYIALNALAAFLALYLLDVFGAIECAENQCTLRESTEHVLLAGLGAMAVLRASILTLRVQDQDVGVGPAAILQIYLNVADRATDRRRATARAESIAGLMKAIDFDKAKVSLPATCFALMQNVSADEQKIISNQVNSLQGAEIAPAVKSIILGLSLLDIVGENALRAAIQALGDDIKV